MRGEYEASQEHPLAATMHQPIPTLSRPAYQEATHSERQAEAQAIAPAWPKPFKRPHSHPPAAIRIRTTTVNGTGEGQNKAGNRIASRTIAVMIRCFSMVCRPGQAAFFAAGGDTCSDVLPKRRSRDA